MDHEREIRTVFDKNSKDLLNLVNGLKNDGLQNRLLQSLLEKHDTNKVTVISEAREKFKKHPVRIASHSELSVETVKNGFCKDYYPDECFDSCEVQRENSELMYRFLQQPKPKAPTKRLDFPTDHRCFSKTQVAVLSSQAMEVVEKASVINVTVQEEQQHPENLNHPFNEKVVLHPQPDDNATKKTAESYKKLHQKLRNMVPKVVECIEEIRMLLNDKIPEPDGEEDWERRRMRAVEFSTRFNRNYLYHLGRQITELQKLTRNLGHTGQIVVNAFQYLTNTHHTVLKAMQAYRNHLPAALPHFAVDKLKTILEYICIICEIHSKCFTVDNAMSSRSENLISELKKKNKNLLIKVQDFIEETGENPFSVSLLQLNTEAKAPKKKKPKKVSLEARLSMYSISSNKDNHNRKEAFWKQTVQALAKDKLKYNHVQSRYKTAGFKHRPPIEKPAEPPPKPKLFQKKSASIVRPTPLVSVRNEDDIPTMVGMQKQKEREFKINTTAAEHGQLPNHTNMELFLKALQNEYQKYLASATDGDMTQEQWDSFVKSLLETDLLGKINTGSNQSGSKKNGVNNPNETNFVEVAQEVVRHVYPTLANEGHNGLANTPQTKISLDKKRTSSTPVEKPRQNGEADAIVSPRSDVTLTEENSKPNDSYDIVELFKSSRTKSKQKKKTDKPKDSRRQTVTVTGAKNAQLICICDEDSIVESLHESKAMLTNSKVKEPNVCNKSSSPNQLINSGKAIKTGNPRMSRGCITKISRLPRKSLKSLVLMPQEQVTNVLKYKFQYSKFVKGNYLYQRTSKIKPWILVEKLSEHLLDDLLLSIADDIQISKVVESLIRSEFQ